MIGKESLVTIRWKWTLNPRTMSMILSVSRSHLISVVLETYILMVMNEFNSNFHFINSEYCKMSQLQYVNILYSYGSWISIWFSRQHFLKLDRNSNKQNHFNFLISVWSWHECVGFFCFPYPFLFFPMWLGWVDLCNIRNYPWVLVINSD